MFVFYFIVMVFLMFLYHNENKNCYFVTLFSLDFKMIFCSVFGVLWDIADKKVDKEIKTYEVDEPFKSRLGTGLKWVS